MIYVRRLRFWGVIIRDRIQKYDVNPNLLSMCFLFFSQMMMIRHCPYFARNMEHLIFIAENRTLQVAYCLKNNIV